MRQIVPMLELTDYLEILRKRKGLILACLVVGLVGAWAVFMLMPKVYRSSTLVLVDTQKVPADVIKPVTMDSTIEERLISLQQQILSRTHLQKIIEEFSLYRDELGGMSLDDVIEHMRRQIKITTVDDHFRKTIQAFTISYDGAVPQTVMQVTDKLATLFIEENMKAREQIVEGTSELLDQELLTLQRELKRQEAQITEYKQQHMGALPEQAEANLRTLERLQVELHSANETLSMAEEKRQILKEALSDPSVEPLLAGVPRSPLRERLFTLRTELVKLQSEYKETYPDVADTKRQIRDLEAQLAAEEAIEAKGGPRVTRSLPAAAASGVSAPAQIRALDAEIQTRKMRQGEIERMIKTYEARVEEIPKHQQQLAILIRDYDNSKRNYEMLTSKQMAAKISENLEKRQQGEQFRIIDPANLPTKPVKPDPMSLLLGGLVAGLAMAGGSIWWRDIRNAPFRRPEEVEAALGLPTLATIPRMSGLWSGEGSSEAMSGLLIRNALERGGNGKELQPDTVGQRPQRAALPWKGQSLGSRRSQVVLQANLNALAGEQFRVLASRITRLREKKGLRVLALTSALAGEGKSTLAVGLAVTLARDYLEETILIDGDLRNSSISARLGLHDQKGLRNVLAGEVDLDSVLNQHTCPRLKILTAGTSRAEQPGLTATCGEAQKLFEMLRRRDVFVILDAPPILPMADMNLYAEIVDGMMLVVRAGQTPQHVVARALDFLVGGNVEGVILNGLTNMAEVYFTGYVNTRYSKMEQPALLFQPVGPGRG